MTGTPELHALVDEETHSINPPELNIGDWPSLGWPPHERIPEMAAAQIAGRTTKPAHVLSVPSLLAPVPVASS